MTRNEFVRVLSEKAGMSIKETKGLLDIVEETIVETIKVEDELKLAIGKFKGVDKEAYTAKNPKTGEEVPVAAKRVPKFTAGKLFKDGVN